ncbi:hypothetical protein DITRI_Ditri09bG0102900 [Diplodiscus trichospermus]
MEAEEDHTCRESSFIGFMAISRCPNHIRIHSKPTGFRPLMMWTESSKVTLKFNVDGAAKGKPGPAGIGGVLRDYLGVEKASFSRSLGWRTRMLLN